MFIKSAPPGPASLFSMAAFGRPDQQFLQQLQQQNQVQQQMLQQTYGVDMSAFYNQSNQFFNTYQNLTGMQQAATMIAQGLVETTAIIENTIFTPILNLGDFQKASTVQKTYLMANPFLKNLYLEGKISGFEGQYGSAVGFDDPVFRQAVDGLSQSSYMQLPDDVDEIYVECLDDDLPGLARMSAVEQSNWAQACKLSEVLISEGIDVTHKDLKFIGE